MISEEIVAPSRFDLNNKIADYHSRHSALSRVIQSQPYRFIDDEGVNMWCVNMKRWEVDVVDTTI